MAMKRGSSEAKTESSQSLTFESSFAVKLDELLPKFDEGFMNLKWLKQAVAVVLASHTRMSALTPEITIPLSRKEEKWMNDFLDESSKFLDICNIIRTGTAQVERNQMYIKRLLYILDSRQDSANESTLWRARQAVIDVLAVFENAQVDEPEAAAAEISWPLNFTCTTVSTASEVLQSVSNSLVSPKGSAASRANYDFSSAAYGANLITVLILGALLAALAPACKGGGGPELTVGNVAVSKRYLWSQSLSSLREGVREELVDKKKKESAFRLSELEGIHTCLKLLLELIDSLISERRFPITHFQDKEVQEAVRKLRELSDHLERGLKGLDLQMREFFRHLISNRNAVLDSFAKSD